MEKLTPIKLLQAITLNGTPMQAETEMEVSPGLLNKLIQQNTKFIYL